MVLRKLFITLILQPPDETNLLSNWEGSPVEFFDNSSYSCKSFELYFDIDRDLEFWNITCLDDGSWDGPEEWPNCVECNQ